MSSNKGSLNPKDVGFCENVNLIMKFIYILIIKFIIEYYS